MRDLLLPLRPDHPQPRLVVYNQLSAMSSYKNGPRKGQSPAGYPPSNVQLLRSAASSRVIPCAELGPSIGLGVTALRISLFILFYSPVNAVSSFNAISFSMPSPILLFSRSLFQA